ncbi:MAG: hypothetical protein WC389_00100 [Lutibacter sp.]|jgi:hypothetical protein
MAAELIYTKEPLRVKVPMKPYVVKFLLKKFGKTHKASKNSWLGLNAIELLRKDYCKPVKLTSKNYFTIVIPYSLCVQNGHFVDYTKFPELEKKCENIFRNFMYDFIQINSVNAGSGGVTRSLRNFLAFYKINEDELKSDSVYRQYMRYLNEQMTDLKTDKKKAS